MASAIMAEGLMAAEDLSSYQYYAVFLNVSTDRYVSPFTNANAPQVPIGILQNDPDAAGKAAEVCIFGVCKAIYGGNVTRGDSLSMDNTGRLISDAITEVLAGNALDLFHCAYALESGAVNEVRQVIFVGPRVMGKE